MSLDVASQAGAFFSIPIEHLEAETVLTFDLYIQHGSREPVLYRSQNTEFTPAVRERLVESGVVSLLVPDEQARAYKSYRKQQGALAEGRSLDAESEEEAELGLILADPHRPVEERSNTLLGVSRGVVEVALSDLGSPGLARRVGRVAEETARFLIAEPDAFAVMVDLLAMDSETYGHMSNVSLYTIELARAAGYEDLSALSAIGRGALLHDVGKADLPEDLLRKERYEELSDLEYAELMNHTHLGVNRLVEARWDDAMTLDIVANHHERCDGSGWPAGLTRDQLSEASRIVAIADVFDTLTTSSAQGIPLTGYQALWKIKREMGGQFDPELLDQFIQVMVDPRRLG